MLLDGRQKGQVYHPFFTQKCVKKQHESDVLFEKTRHVPITPGEFAPIGDSTTLQSRGQSRSLCRLACWCFRFHCTPNQTLKQPQSKTKDAANHSTQSASTCGFTQTAVTHRIADGRWRTLSRTCSSSFAGASGIRSLVLSCGLGHAC